MRYDTIGIREFIRDYPGMVFRPTADSALVLTGLLSFTAKSGKLPDITDEYRLQIRVQNNFPKSLPDVTELGNKIRRTDDFHINSDGTLCLGSRLRLLMILSKNPTLVGYTENCIVPYLYAISYKLKFGKKLPFGELPHGPTGELEDYVKLFGLKNIEQAKNTISLLRMSKRQANKKPCPCNCGSRVGKCGFNKKLEEFRKLTSRSWFRALSSYHNI
jgi:hypothetical protein